ncbi:MAG: Hsp70 family protein [Deltaproteobacteria bacterium]|nr:Hsp70 family protein [Deltaproteobacteria bacterium]
MGRNAGALGLDFGTTNTTLASLGRPLPLGETGATLLPSALAFVPSGAMLVGDPARHRRAMDPMNTLVSTKRVLGAALGSEEAKRFAASTPYKLSERAGEVALETRCGAFRASDVARLVTTQALTLAGLSSLAVPILVVGVPATFTRSRRSTVIDAMRSLGFADVRVVDEPVLTAVAYVGRSSVRRGLVFDLGGGTFDVALIDGTTFPFRVLAQGGDAYLGGDDVDRALAQRVRERVLRESGWDLASDPVAFDKLVHAVERAKVRLTFDDAVLVEIAEVDPAAPTSVASVRLTRAMLSDALAPLVTRMMTIVDEVLARADTAPNDLDAIFLAGGSTRLPGLREALEARFGKRTRHDVDPSCTVAIGASFVAARPELAQLFAG